MVETFWRQSPLAHLGLAARAAQDAAKSDAGVMLAEHVGRGQLILRGAADASFCEAVARAVGVAPPTVPNTAAGPPDLADGSHILWLGPNEWLVVTPSDKSFAAAESLETALAGRFAAAIDVGDARAAIRLSGTKARAVLMKGCSLDLHPRVFGPGQCAQTLLARAGVVLHATAFDKVTDAAAYDLYVPRSLAEYLWAWLEDAAEEYGLKVI